MGVPDLLKFVAKSAPGALCRVPHETSGEHVAFDYVLVDATNVAQTMGFELVKDFFKKPSVVVNVAVIFVLDSQRRRVGTAREQRSHGATQDTELLVRKTAAEIIAHWKSACRDQEAKKIPAVVMSGRDVSGEADYKMLHLHRSIASAHMAQKRPAPTFLMISEDSDVLCGCMCGLAPQQVSLGTTLRDTTLELCLLRLSFALAYVGQLADVLLFGDNAQSAVAPAVPVAPPTPVVPVQEDVIAVTTEEADDAIRRKKKDGPMIAMGTKLKLDDSDDEDSSPPTAPVPPPIATASRQQAAPQKPHLPLATATAVPNSYDATIHEIEVAGFLRSVCVDFVFLFTMVMGNCGSVAALARGATKVDIHTCWQMYCQKKYSVEDEQQKVNSLLSVTTGSKKNDYKAYVQVNCAFLHSVLQNLNYSDPLSRPPVEEERERALRYLQKAVQSTVRYILACHVSGAPTLISNDKAYRCFLDTRVDCSDDDSAPSLAALIAVLASQQKHTFLISMRGDVIGNVSDVNPVFGGLNLQTDVEGTLVSLSNSTIVPITQLVGSNSLLGWKSIAAFVEEVTKDMPSASGLFERIDAMWTRSVASGIKSIQEVARAFKSMSAFSQMSGKKNKQEQAQPLQSAESNRVLRGPTTYSFELRRMAPVVGGGVVVPPASTAPPTAAAVAATTKSAAIAGLLGISYSYADEPVMKLDPAIQNFSGTEKKKAEKRPREDHGQPDGGAGAPKAPGASKSKRLGKKEREKLKALKQKQQANGGATALVASPGATATEQ